MNLLGMLSDARYVGPLVQMEPEEWGALKCFAAVASGKGDELQYRYPDLEPEDWQRAFDMLQTITQALQTTTDSALHVTVEHVIQIKPG